MLERELRMRVVVPDEPEANGAFGCCLVGE
jgi:activator of 2-hydroxyglutaryl-CoA dehydratase